ncbi:hypothetical protein GXB81_27490 [Paraburkholderia sp. Ac-20336]|nr:hypothetical protein [Paraburkholderia sp. Ac-20336]
MAAPSVAFFHGVFAAKTQRAARWSKPGFAVPHDLDLPCRVRPCRQPPFFHYREAFALHAAMTRASLASAGHEASCADANAEAKADAARHTGRPGKTLGVGIGCRLGSSAQQIEAAVRAALGSHTCVASFEQIHAVATLDAKAHEAGLREFCARHALPLQVFSREQIAAVPVATPSLAAQTHLGVDGVCEPCALLAAQTLAAASAAASPTQPARLLVPKTVHDGVTVAIASASSDADTAPTQPDTPQQDLR